ncbi:MAG: 3-oxoacyl-ACP reductase family protein [Candidatus Diapherotrites archaeon]
MNEFSGKVAIVTGASGGIGKAIAVALGEQKAKVVVNYNGNALGANETKAEIEKLGGKAIAVKADVSKPAEVEKMVEAAVKEFGGIDFLVNNAGITADATLKNMRAEQWNRVMETNLNGTFNCTKAVLPLMLGKGKGSIVNISSISGSRGSFGQCNYSAAKAAVIGFTKSVSRETAGKGVRVNAICPGYVKTKMTESVPKELIEKFVEMIPMKRPGTTGEIAEAVLFFLSEKSSYISGQALNVDGGFM